MDNIFTVFMMYWDKCWALAHVYKVKFNNVCIYSCWCCKLQFEESSVLVSKWYRCLLNPVHNRQKYLLLITANSQLVGQTYQQGALLYSTDNTELSGGGCSSPPCGCAGQLGRDWPSFPASGIKICPGWSSVPSITAEQRGDVLIPQLPPGPIGQKREKETTPALEHISAEGPPGRSRCREVRELPCSVTALCVVSFSFEKLKVWK